MIKRLLFTLFTVSSALSLGGCFVAARGQPVTYSPGYYGYQTQAAPNTVYYQGGNYNNSYYPAGYYQRSAPFFSASTAVYANPGYAQPTAVYANPGYGQQTVYANPGYGQQTVVAQPVYAQPAYRPGMGVNVGGGVGVGSVVGVGAGMGVRVGP